MAVNFGTFEGHRILTDSTNKNVDRLINAVKEKKRQEEEAERLKLEQDRFNQSKSNADRILTQKKDFISNEIARYEESTGYTGEAEYDKEGNFVGVTSALKDNKPIPTFAKKHLTVLMQK